ncbi:preprotein translocase subunit SecG [Pseudomonadota bacterium]
MVTVLTVIQFVLAGSLIGLVLVQRGKGADLGAAFGSGASSTVFGSQGAASFLTRATAVVATLFFVTSLTLGYLAGQRVDRKSVTEIEQQVEQGVEIQADVPVEPSDKPDLPVE